ncbi:MAG: LytR/AlgR family response regulator transcription factor [Prolixibacteraceae bacterium]
MSLKILIVEDEPLAAAQLAALIAGIKPDAQIVAVCDSIESSVKWIENNELPDLSFFDIHLGDGLSFEIFKTTKFEAPVIFTTAYDKYTLQAFKVNSIDYLLKPIDKTELQQAILKFEQTTPLAKNSLSDEQLQIILQSVIQKEYRKRFLVKIGTHLKAIQTCDVSFFYSLQKGTYLKTYDGKTYLLDQTLETIEELIDPAHFFRMNRKYIVALNSIHDVSIYSNSRLKLKVNGAEEDDFFVSREKVKLFKSWMEGTD